MSLATLVKAKLHEWERVPERYWTHSSWIAEWWCTVSNVMFVCLGLARLREIGQLGEDATVSGDNGGFSAQLHAVHRANAVLLYRLFVLAGFCSAVHHATVPKWTIVIDWVPISISSLLSLYLGVLPCVTLATAFQLVLAFGLLFNDHVYKTVPVPWGHSFWHILAAIAVDSMYQDYIHYAAMVSRTGLTA
eukprot:TRINITY_DN106766_c0_g1_i1.p2 TRINITY_DN106766_c0_g1~~TRINITY_DN106766_c0_g1_i1.p2  ORF type:complete len:191 (+),score=42.06 TRINITY_DN106766_c0_g1_i1:3-575(+)